MAGRAGHALRVSWICWALSLLKGSMASPFCDLGETGPLAIFDPVMLCVFLSTNPPKKMIFRLKVEEYGSVILTGSKTIALGGALTQVATDAEGRSATVDNATAQDAYTWISASTTSPANPLNCKSEVDIEARRSYSSCPQIYSSPNYIATLLSLVINLRDGVIHSFIWDNSCAACGPQRCMRSALSLNTTSSLPGSELDESGCCGLSHADCSASPEDCDLQVLVTWAGTDKEGRHLQSAGRRISRFSGATVASMYETFDDTLR